jgi:hypothetical protein
VVPGPIAGRDDVVPRNADVGLILGATGRARTRISLDEVIERGRALVRNPIALLARLEAR